MPNIERRRRIYNCSFCGKNQDQILRLIAGPGNVYICNECVDVFLKEEAEQKISSVVSQTGKNRGQTNRCSFCGKKLDKVKNFFTTASGITICDECIDLCHEIIVEGQ